MPSMWSRNRSDSRQLGLDTASAGLSPDAAADKVASQARGFPTAALTVNVCSRRSVT